ncbi:hypothetical protein CJ255_20695 [Candidatus Viridilinea mediisalina]|uniref:Uncharacterized protein n=1 Tax=Candidatus Viridilinea mediisalina TaxID=2024553 RepID=A0A2A6RDX3_9CHLR|nr:hypothetical protein CJ255_20695 [Candidatus Viridilinea mediisalina]
MEDARLDGGEVGCVPVVVGRINIARRVRVVVVEIVTAAAATVAVDVVVVEDGATATNVNSAGGVSFGTIVNHYIATHRDRT